MKLKKYYITLASQNKYNCPNCGKAFVFGNCHCISSDCDCFYGDENGIIITDKKHVMKTETRLQRILEY